MLDCFLDPATIAGTGRKALISPGFWKRLGVISTGKYICAFDAQILSEVIGEKRLEKNLNLTKIHLT